MDDKITYEEIDGVKYRVDPEAVISSWLSMYRGSQLRVGELLKEDDGQGWSTYQLEINLAIPNLEYPYDPTFETLILGELYYFKEQKDCRAPRTKAIDQQINAFRKKTEREVILKKLTELLES